MLRKFLISKLCSCICTYIDSTFEHTFKCRLFFKSAFHTEELEEKNSFSAPISQSEFNENKKGERKKTEKKQNVIRSTLSKKAALFKWAVRANKSRSPQEYIHIKKLHKFCIKILQFKKYFVVPLCCNFFNDKILLNRLAFIIIFVIDDKCFSRDLFYATENVCMKMRI